MKGGERMKKRYVIAILLMIGLFLLPSVIGVVYGTITCTYYGVPINRYICSDKNVFVTQQAMVNYYTPPLVQTQPDYTFVTGGSTEGMMAIP